MVGFGRFVEEVTWEKVVVRTRIWFSLLGGQNFLRILFCFDNGLWKVFIYIYTHFKQSVVFLYLLLKYSNVTLVKLMTKYFPTVTYLTKCFKKPFWHFERMSHVQILNEVLWFRTNFELFFSPYGKRLIKLIWQVVMGSIVK